MEPYDEPIARQQSLQSILRLRDNYQHLRERLITEEKYQDLILRGLYVAIERSQAFLDRVKD